MQREALDDLAAAAPHMAPRLVLEPREREVYARGYYMALSMALKCFDHAEARFALYRRTKRLETKRRREQEQ